MPIRFSCECGKTLRADEAQAGKRAKCPSCGQVVKIPAADQPAPSAAPKLPAQQPVAVATELRRFEIQPGQFGDSGLAAISPDGQAVAAGHELADVRLWDAASGNELHRFGGGRYALAYLAFSADGQFLRSCDCTGLVLQWNLKTGQECGRFQHPMANTNYQSKVVLSPDGVFVAASTQDHKIWLMHIAAFEHFKAAKNAKEVLQRAIRGGVYYLPGHKDHVSCLAFSADGQVLVSGSGDRTIRVWDVAAGKELQSFELEDLGVSTLALSPNGRYILSGSGRSSAELLAIWGHDVSKKKREPLLRLWDRKSGEEIEGVKDPVDSVWQAAFLPGGKFALTAGEVLAKQEDGRAIPTNCNLHLWRLATGNEVQRFIGHEKTIRSIAVSADGRYAVSGSGDNTARLWKLPS